MAKKDLSNLGLNRFLVKDYDKSYSDDPIYDASLKVSDAKSPSYSGATTFDVTQTSDFLINKTLKNCSFIDNFYLFSSVGSGHTLAGGLSAGITPNGRSVSLSTIDGISVLTLFESTSRNYASITSGEYELHIGIADVVYPSGATFVGGFLNLPQLTNTEATALTPQNGSMYYNTTTNNLMIYKSGAWKTVTTS